MDTTYPFTAYRPPMRRCLSETARRGHEDRWRQRAEVWMTRALLDPDTGLDYIDPITREVDCTHLGEDFAQEHDAYVDPDGGDFTIPEWVWEAAFHAATRAGGLAS